MNVIVRLLVSTIAVLITDLLLRGVSLGDLDNVNGVLTAVLTAAVLALLNNLLRPLLIILTLPITFLTLGLFLFVINAGLVLLAAKIVPGFTVESCWWALGFSLVLSIVQGLLNALDRKPKEGRGPRLFRPASTRALITPSYRRRACFRGHRGNCLPPSLFHLRVAQQQ